MLNSVVLIGRLTKDPELRYTPSGKAVANLRLAVDRGEPSINRARGRRTSSTSSCGRSQAETVANYLQKGRLVAVQGRLQIRQYTNQEGQRREKAEVVASTVRFLDSARDHAGGEGRCSAPRREEGMGSELTFNDDEDVPF